MTTNKIYIFGVFPQYDLLKSASMQKYHSVSETGSFANFMFLHLVSPRMNSPSQGSQGQVQGSYVLAWHSDFIYVGTLPPPQ